MSPVALEILVSDVVSSVEVTSLVFLPKLALLYEAWKKDRGLPRKRWREQDHLQANELRGIYKGHNDDDDDIMRE